jgi:hypothetical protein
LISQASGGFGVVPDGIELFVLPAQTKAAGMAHVEQGADIARDLDRTLRMLGPGLYQRLRQE